LKCEYQPPLVLEHFRERVREHPCFLLGELELDRGPHGRLLRRRTAVCSFKEI